ncbi:MAG TPA: hypothetical protein VM075_02655 [Anaerolineae bacterium]|nr:hypothetical protein [Anaerolineae bacterium]
MAWISVVAAQEAGPAVRAINMLEEILSVEVDSFKRHAPQLELRRLIVMGAARQTAKVL